MNFESKSLRTSSVTSTSTRFPNSTLEALLWPATGPTALTSRSVKPVSSRAPEMPSSRKAGTSGRRHAPGHSP